MRRRGSRYEHVPAFTPDPSAGEVFRGLRPRDIGPATGVIEHVVKAGDRLDLLARHYYNDDRLWWRILDANPSFLLNGDLLLDEAEGTVIHIPRGRE
jgi:nucleoid-associated protein YgaU